MSPDSILHHRFSGEGLPVPETPCDAVVTSFPPTADRNPFNLIRPRPTSITDYRWAETTRAEPSRAGGGQCTYGRAATAGELTEFARYTVDKQDSFVVVDSITGDTSVSRQDVSPAEPNTWTDAYDIDSQLL